MKPIKKIVLLHDMCGVGKAALTNMMPILSVMGIEVCPLPTILLSTHTGGYGLPAIYKINPDYIRECADHYVNNDVTFDMIFIGYIGSIDMVEAVEYFINKFPGTPIIMDPIMGDHGRYYSNFDKLYGNAIKKLLSSADIILPNLTEGILLTGMDYKQQWTNKSIKMLCEKLQELGSKNIIITSVPVGKNKKGIVFCHDKQITIMEKKQISSDYHGTGDAFDGVFIGNLLKGSGMKESVDAAHDFVCACIEESNKYDYDKREGLMIENNLSMLISCVRKELKKE